MTEYKNQRIELLIPAWLTKHCSFIRRPGVPDCCCAWCGKRYRCRNGCAYCCFIFHQRRTYPEQRCKNCVRYEDISEALPSYEELMKTPRKLSIFLLQDGLFDRIKQKNEGEGLKIELLIPEWVNQCYSRDICICFGCKNAYRCHYGCIECVLYLGMRANGLNDCPGFEDISQRCSYKAFMALDGKTLEQYLHVSG